MKCKHLFPEVFDIHWQRFLWCKSCGALYHNFYHCGPKWHPPEEKESRKNHLEHDVWMQNELFKERKCPKKYSFYGRTNIFFVSLRQYDEKWARIASVDRKCIDEQHVAWYLLYGQLGGGRT